MTFLNAALLFALTLGLLPILIHLLTRQRLKRISFPTLRFLKELQRRKMRQLKLRQILLLILRTLAVLALVLAMARPVLQSTAGILPGVHARTSVFLVMDRSASMSTETPEGTRLREASVRAQEVLSLLKEGDEAQIIWADAEPTLFPPEPTSRFRAVREAISETRVTKGGSNLTKALELARFNASKSKNLHREIYVLSDFSISAWPEGLPDGPLFPPDVKLFLLPVGQERFSNVGITDVRILSRLMTPGRPVELQATLKNSSQQALPDRLVSVFLGGRRVASRSVSIGASETKQIEFRFVPEIPGAQGGYIKLEEGDDLSIDDQRHFVLNVPDQLKIGLVAPQSPGATFTALALNPTGNADAFVQVVPLTPGAFEAADWSSFDAFLIMEAPAFSAGIGARLHSFVESGKGVLVMLGPGADLRAHNAWLPELGLPALGDVWAEEGSSTRWTDVDWAHPVFEGLFEETPKSISPAIQQLVRPIGNKALTVISTGIGIPFLVEARIGRGHAMLITSSPEPEWSDFYRTGIFPPLMVRLAAYLSGSAGDAEALSFDAGVSGTIQRLGIAPTTPAELVSENENFQIIPRAIPAGFEYPVPPVKEPGIYRLKQDTRDAMLLAINIPAIETEINALPIDNAKEFWGGKIARTIRTAGLSEIILESRFGRELWKSFLILALILLVAEMLLARSGKPDEN